MLKLAALMALPVIAVLATLAVVTEPRVPQHDDAGQGVVSVKATGA